VHNNNVNNSFSPTILIRNRQNTESLGKLKEGDITEEDVNKDGTNYCYYIQRL